MENTEKMISALFVVLLKKRIISEAELDKMEQVINSTDEVSKEFMTKIWEVLK